MEKEVRALLPAWTACALTLLVTPHIAAFAYLGLPVYLVGVLGLGAFSIGHEYTHRTIAGLLMSPVPRSRIWATKLGVLLPMVFALALLASGVVVLDRSDRVLSPAVFWLPAIAACTVAPWLAMTARSPLAGAVFTMGVIGMALVVGEWIGTVRYGFTREADGARLAFMWWALGSLSVLSAAAGWITFARLEDSGTAADIELGFGRRRAVAPGLRRQHPVVALVRKELRLQQLAYVVAAIYVIGILALTLAGPKAAASGIVVVLTTFFVLALPAVVGALASAEERRFGTNDTQLLMPASRPLQWSIKCGTAMALALALGVLLPWLLTSLLPRQVALAAFGPPGHIQPQMIAVAAVSAAVSLYVSTIASSGIAALMASIPTLMGMAFFLLAIAGDVVGRRVFDLVHAARSSHDHRHLVYLGRQGWSEGSIVALVALLLLLAYWNYRDGGRRSAVGRHAAIVAIAILAYSAVINTVMALRY